ncbi:DinB family protein [Sphingobacterium zeae]|uniref:DinB family protein n=1 Tax=Sphingobacterium zeae TaxID=1776859 RepID=UPI00360F3B75
MAFHNKVNDILLHVFNHGTYHRAQIASEMRRNSVELKGIHNFQFYNELSLLLNELQTHF